MVSYPVVHGARGGRLKQYMIETPLCCRSYSEEFSGSRTGLRPGGRFSKPDMEAV
jgi:hypothetical protein